MKDLCRRRRPAGKWELAPCVIGLLTGTAAALLASSVMSYLVYQAYLPLHAARTACWIIPALSTVPAVCIAGKLASRRKGISGLLTTALLLAAYAAAGLFQKGRTGRGLLLGSGIILIVGILVSWLGTAAKRKLY